MPPTPDEEKRARDITIDVTPDIPADIPADIAAELKRAGLHVTAQRLAVLKAVRALPHAMAEDISARVREDIGAISRQAVYDALNTMAERGLVRRIQPAGSAARYEDQHGDNHHHLVCRRCDAVVDVACASGTAPCLSTDHDHGYLIDEAEVIYWGVCPDCQLTTD